MYNILTEFVMPMKLLRLIKLRVRETSSRLREVMLFRDMFPIRNVLKHEGTLSPFLINFAFSRTLGGFR